MSKKPTTPGDWFQWDEPDGEWENHMAMLESDSNRVPSVSPPFKNKGEKLGAYIHHYMACKLLKEEPVFESSYWKYLTYFYGDRLMSNFVDKYVDEVVGVEATIKHPFESSKKVRCDLLAYCKDPYGECSGGWGPTCIIDWKFISGKKFYYDNYDIQMDLYREAYNDAQMCNSGPFLSHVLVVAIFGSGRVSIHRYHGSDTRE
jgi:hypothetical protein